MMLLISNKKRTWKQQETCKHKKLSYRRETATRSVRWNLVNCCTNCCTIAVRKILGDWLEGHALKLACSTCLPAARSRVVDRISGTLSLRRAWNVRESMTRMLVSAFSITYRSPASVVMPTTSCGKLRDDRDTQQPDQEPEPTAQWRLTEHQWSY